MRFDLDERWYKAATNVECLNYKVEGNECNKTGSFIKIILTISIKSRLF